MDHEYNASTARFAAHQKRSNTRTLTLDASSSLSVSNHSSGVIAGLEGVPAAATALSHVEGDAGRLVLCGEELADFVARHGFESAAATFWSIARGEAMEASAWGEAGTSALGTAVALEAMPGPGTPLALATMSALGKAREDAFARFGKLAPALAGLTPSEGLRLCLASLPENDAALHLAVTAAIPVFVANVARVQADRALVPPQPDSPHVEDFLRMLQGGDVPDAADVAALTTYLVTVMDHGMNASTFTSKRRSRS